MKNNLTIEYATPAIDLRIIYPDAALKYVVKELTPYIPPTFSLLTPLVLLHIEARALFDPFLNSNNLYSTHKLKHLFIPL